MGSIGRSCFSRFSLGKLIINFVSHKEVVVDCFLHLLNAKLNFCVEYYTSNSCFFIFRKSPDRPPSSAPLPGFLAYYKIPQVKPHQ